jgi:hypothetical protein
VNALTEHASLLAAMDGKAEVAARLYGYGLAMMRDLGQTFRESVGQALIDKACAFLEGALPAGRLAQLLEETAQWDEDQVLALLQSLAAHPGIGLREDRVPRIEARISQMTAR